MTAYSYTIAAAFPNARVLPSLLQSEIQESPAITTAMRFIDTGGGVCTIDFAGSLSPAEKAALDGIVSVHPGQTVVPEFITNTPLIAGDVPITSQDWMTLGGVVTNVGFFCPVEQSYGELLGSAKATGAGAQLRLVEDDNGDGGGTVVAAGPCNISDGDWSVIRFNSLGHTPREGARCYRLEGRLNGATAGSARFLSLTLFQLVVLLGVTE